ncbi:PucR family transcriptional regulator [Bifidobacterium sp. 64T4]|uniref:PucR family transcriptional regulator n=1 Tax=Bifidobacterium pongonis TaxID=2834432 RepID=UPI001C580C96|nr:PucR family transcriptional regulator [Bifidobacterium pongonis]MBW3094078.1 PucR family transcriptional regulator [Bifidobacterium pongonis]
MAITVTDVLHDGTLQQALPKVEVSGGGLDRPVRWVFANEREDAASFLYGGELLIIEGQTLLADGRRDSYGEYVQSLVNAGIAALVIELVEGITELPEDFRTVAEQEGLTVIGLHGRIPFVDICQSVNTAIVRRQMKMQMEVDTMSTMLRDELTFVNNIDELTVALSCLFNESVAIFDAEGLPVARAGKDLIGGDADGSTAVLALSGRKRPVGSLEITQSTITFDETMRRRIEQIVSPVAALYMDGGARIGMIAHLTQGPRDGIHVTSMEAREDHDMLEALHCAGASVYLPFMIDLRSVVGGIGAVSAMIDAFEAKEGHGVLCLLEGGTLMGCMVASDGGGDIVDFVKESMEALRLVDGDPSIYAVYGKAAQDTITLVDGFGALRAAMDGMRKRGNVPYGTVASVDESLIERLLSVERTEDAIHMLVTQTVGFELLQMPVLLDTLCACFDNLDNKTGACEQLGVQRQTLYNRLDKVTQMLGISPSDRTSWALLLFGAKMARTWQETR